MCPAHRDHGEFSATGRITSVLEAFRDDHDALTLSELARRTALPKTTAHRLTGELVRCGLLERAGSEFRLGLKLFELGQLVPQQRSLRDAARPVMADLREATRHSVNFGVLEGTDVVYIDILAGPDAPMLPTRVGGRWPAHATAIGKAVLAFSGPATVDAVVAAGLPRISERTIIAPGLFLAELDRIRDEGLAYDLEESRPGLVCVASPVHGPGGVVRGALSVSGWSSRMKADRAGPAVRTAALTISRALGAQNLPARSPNPAAQAVPAGNDGAAAGLAGTPASRPGHDSAAAGLAGTPAGRPGHDGRSAR
jgi:DNA-binding IclR family transcriptional regulator